MGFNLFRRNIYLHFQELEILLLHLSVCLSIYHYYRLQTNIAIDMFSNERLVFYVSY